MSAAVSLYLRSELLRCYFLERADPVYLALTRATPPANATGDQLVEPAAGGYARAPYRLGSGYWAETGFGEVYNTRVLTWPTPGDDWGLLLGWALCTAPTSGLTLAVGQLQRPSSADAGIPVTAGPGACSVALL